MNPILLYALIFFAKIIEVTVAVFRTVLITKGERKIATFIAFFEVMLWLIIVAAVLNNITDDPIKMVAYSGGFAIGQFLGSWLEDKVGLGTVRVEIIVPFENGSSAADYLRSMDYAVTIIEGCGRDSQKKILLMYMPRKESKKFVNILKKNIPNSVITVDDVKPVYGGYHRIIK